MPLYAQLVVGSREAINKNAFRQTVTPRASRTCEACERSVTAVGGMDVPSSELINYNIARRCGEDITGRLAQQLQAGRKHFAHPFISSAHRFEYSTRNTDEMEITTLYGDYHIDLWSI